MFFVFLQTVTTATITSVLVVYVALQERWPEKYGHDVMVRRPYPSIALEATGRRWLYYVTEIGIDITNFGVGVVDLLIAGGSLHCTLLPNVPVSKREWLFIVTGQL